MANRNSADQDQLVFLQHTDVMIVYVARAPDLQLTSIYAHIQSQQSSQVARECIRHLYWLQADGAPLTAPVPQIRQAVERMMTALYQVTFLSTLHHTRIRCSPGVSVDTVSTVLARLRTAFRTAIDLKLRSDQPMDTVTLKPSQLRRYREFQRNNSVYIGRRSPLYYYKVQAHGNHIPVNIIDNPELPSHMRQAIRQACWSERDWAVFEVLISSGARVAEVCEATWAGVSSEGFEVGLALHTKGQGRLPYKSTSLTPEALTALTRYCATERTEYDPLHVQFHAWNRGRSWTSSRYLEFLKKRKINPATVPIFVNERGKPYNRNAFDKNPIAKLRNRAKDSRNSGLRLLVSAHHWRHWYINLQLDKIAASSQNVDEHTDMLVKFVDDMGWKHWSGLSHYDHRGQATKLLRAREKSIEGNRKAEESRNSEAVEQSFRVGAGIEEVLPEERS